MTASLLDSSGCDLTVLGLGAGLPADPYTEAFSAIAQAVEGISKEVVPIAAGFGQKDAQSELAQEAATAQGAQRSSVEIAKAQASGAVWSSLAFPLAIGGAALGGLGLYWWLR